MRGRSLLITALAMLSPAMALAECVVAPERAIRPGEIALATHIFEAEFREVLEYDCTDPVLAGPPYLYSCLATLVVEPVASFNGRVLPAPGTVLHVPFVGTGYGLAAGDPIAPLVAGRTSGLLAMTDAGGRVLAGPCAGPRLFAIDEEAVGEARAAGLLLRDDAD